MTNRRGVEHIALFLWTQRVTRTPVLRWATPARTSVHRGGMQYFRPQERHRDNQVVNGATRCGGRHSVVHHGA